MIKEEPEMIRKCLHCGKEYNPCEDFIEDYELAEALLFFIDEENYCSECLINLHEQMDGIVDQFIGENK